MKCASFALSLFLALPSVAAVGNLGFDIGTKRNQDGQCKTTEDYESDFDHMSQYTKTVKIYAASDCNALQNIGPALVSRGFELFLGVWPNDDAHFQQEKAALSSYLPSMSTSNIKGILVGSESLYRKEQTGQSLANAINDVKNQIKDIKDKDGNAYSSVPVGTVDSWNEWVDDANIPAIQASDLIMANAFSYWQGQAQDNATYSFFDDIMQAIQHMQTAKGTDDINFWVGETGWPSAGETYKNAVPGVDNAATFWQQGVCALRGWGINTLVFEAFDETWKPDTKADDGTEVGETERNWGVLKADGSPKYDLSCDFN